MPINRTLAAVGAVLAVGAATLGPSLLGYYLPSTFSPTAASRHQVQLVAQGRVQAITDGCLSAASVRPGQAVTEEPCARSSNWVVQTIAGGWMKLRAAGSRNCLSPGDALTNELVLDPCSSPASTIFEIWAKDGKNELSFVILANSGYGGVITWRGLGNQLVYSRSHGHAPDQLLRLPKPTTAHRNLMGGRHVAHVVEYGLIFRGA